MPSHEDQHPGPTALTEFALGSLPDDCAETVANHIAGCATCAAAVDAAPPDLVLRRLSAVIHATERTASQAPNSTPTPTEFPVPAPLRRQTRYHDFHLLGVGGMGLIFKAWQPAAERHVALKVIQPDLVDRPEARTRLLREAKALCQLHHPNIVGIHEVEVLDDLIVIVMEYLEGKNLFELGRDGMLSIRQACRYVQQTARGLQHAHDAGFVHRDIKPENLKIGANGEVKIVDFGLVRCVAAEEFSQDLTASDAILGTPKYMAPEQARDAASASVRTDLYALGCTLFFLLTGRPPFQDKSIIGVLVAQASQAPPSVRNLRPEVPPALDALVQKLLAKDPVQRPQQAQEVIAALEPIIGDEALDRAVPRRRRTRFWSAVVLALGLASLSGMLFVAQRLRVETSHGTIILENLPADAEVTIDDRMATIRREGDSDRVEIRVVPGKRRLEIRHRGATIHSQDVVMQLADRHLVPIRLEEPKSQRTKTEAAARRFALLEKPRGDWSIADPELVQSATDRDAWMVFGERTWKDYDFTGEFMRTKETDGVFFFFRHRQSDTYSSLMLGGHDNSVHILDTWLDSRPQQPQPGWRKCAPCIEQGRWHQVKVSLRGEQCECFLDGARLFTAKMTIREGAVGLRTFKCAVRFRNLKVTAADGAVLLEGLPNLTTAAAESAPAGSGELKSPVAPPSPARQKPPTPAAPLILTGHTHFVWSVAFSPDGKRLISGAQDNTVKLWDAIHGRCLKDLARENYRFTGVTWSPDGKILAACGAGPVIQVWSADSGALLHNLIGHTSGVRCVVISRDGKWLASGSYDKTARLWDLATGREKYVMREHTGLVHGIAFSHDDKHLATGSFDATIRIWDVATGAETGCLRGHHGDVLGLAFDPENQSLASGSLDGAVRIWDLARTGKDRVLRSRTPQQRVFAVAYSPDGKVLASGSDKSLILWDSVTGQELHHLSGHAASVFGLSFSRDGRRLASAGGDHTIRIFEMPNGAPR